MPESIYAPESSFVKQCSRLAPRDGLPVKAGSSALLPVRALVKPARVSRSETPTNIVIDTARLCSCGSTYVAPRTIVTGCPCASQS